MQDKELTLQEKEERWIKALKRKEELRTIEESDWELMSETLYEDDVLIFWKECGETYNFELKGRPHHGLETDFDMVIEGTMKEIFQTEQFGDITFMDYMREKEFPITFKTWAD